MLLPEKGPTGGLSGRVGQDCILRGGWQPPLPLHSAKLN
jgi:hypothetical protein